MALGPESITEGSGRFFGINRLGSFFFFFKGGGRELAGPEDDPGCCRELEASSEFKGTVFTIRDDSVEVAIDKGGFVLVESVLELPNLLK